METVLKVITRWSRFLDKIGGYCYFGLMTLVVVNVISRRVFGYQIVGTIELVEVFTAVAIGLTIAYCELQDEHITVDFVLEYLPVKFQKVVGVFINFLILVFLGASSVMVFQYGYSMQLSGRVTTTMGIPYYPFLYIIAFGFFMYFLVALAKIIMIYRGDKEVAK